MKQIKSTRTINRRVANFINKELNKVLNSINKDIVKNSIEILKYQKF